MSDPSPEKLAELRIYAKNYYSQLSEKYKKIGLKYDSSLEIPILTPSAWKPAILPDDQRVDINFSSPAYVAYSKEKMVAYIKSTGDWLPALKSTANKYGAVSCSTISPTGWAMFPNMRLIENGKEDFSVIQPKADSPTAYGSLVNAAYNSMYTFADDSLMNGSVAYKEPLKGIPVIISAKEAAKRFVQAGQLPEEPNDDYAKTGWLKQVQQKAIGITYQTCYRNATEQQMLQKIQRDYADITNHNNDKEYMAPALQYSKPSEACGDILIRQDTRTTDQRKHDQAEIDMQRKLGTYEEPRRQLVTFQIAGVVNAREVTPYTGNLQDYLKSLTTVEGRTQFDAVIPQSLYASLPISLKISDDLLHEARVAGADMDRSPFVTYIVDFNSPVDARNFLTNEGCRNSNYDCSRTYFTDPYGSNYLVLDELGESFDRVMQIILPFIYLITAIIIWFIMSRIMSESRHETVAYGALGASRRDISAIYVYYTLIVVGSIALLSFVIGAAGAYVINMIYSNHITEAAHALFGFATSKLNFVLFDLSNITLLLAVLSGIISIGILAVIQPISRNSR